MKTTGLNFIEAVKAAKEGKKIRRAKWQDKNADGSPSCLVASVSYLRFLDGQDFFPSIETFLAEDWEIVPDPPKTMGFMEVLQHFKQGKTICRLGRGYKFSYFPGHPHMFSLQEIDATDWVVVD